jgi:galactokinase
MTGGGFGGCTVTLLLKAHVNDLIKNIQVKILVYCWLL